VTVLRANEKYPRNLWGENLKKNMENKIENNLGTQWPTV
jgi:hypothetical protein